jgi:hypothetical protein
LNRDFWVEDGKPFAIALDADGRRVDLHVEHGHLPWSDIVDTSRAQAVVRQLMSELLFYGWEVRTLAVGEGPLMLGLEPVGQHLVPEAALPSTMGRLELLDIRGRWDRNDGFARGRVDTSPMDRTR